MYVISLSLTSAFSSLKHEGVARSAASWSARSTESFVLDRSTTQQLRLDAGAREILDHVATHCRSVRDHIQFVVLVIRIVKCVARGAFVLVTFGSMTELLESLLVHVCVVHSAWTHSLSRAALLEIVSCLLCSAVVEQTSKQERRCVLELADLKVICKTRCKCGCISHHCV